MENLQEIIVECENGLILLLCITIFIEFKEETQN